MPNFLLVMLGGAIGAGLRYSVPLRTVTLWLARATA
jgi:fluoride ion exporter CrcB/FEX